MREDRRQPDGGKDVHVVALLRGEGCGRVAGPVVVVGGGERGAGGEETAAVGVLDGVGEGAFGLGGWV